ISGPATVGYCGGGKSAAARVGSNRHHAGFSIVVVGAHQWEAGINTIGNRRFRQMAEALPAVC
ncbi:MAG: hypothetical protein ACKOEO_09540, partial [Planctomycetaceae bacterium]